MLTVSWSEGKSRTVGGLFVVSTGLLGPFIDSVEAPDWYMVLGPAHIPDVLPELFPFASKDFRVDWPLFGFAMFALHCAEQHEKPLPA